MPCRAAWLCWFFRVSAPGLPAPLRGELQASTYRHTQGIAMPTGLDAGSCGGGGFGGGLVLAFAHGRDVRQTARHRMGLASAICHLPACQGMDRDRRSARGHKSAGDVLDAHTPGQLHRQAQFLVDHVKHRLHPLRAAQRQAVERGPANNHAGCAHGQCPENTGASAHATVQKHRHSVVSFSDGFNNATQGGETGGNAVGLPPAVVGGLNGRRSMPGAFLGVLRREDAFDDHWQAGTLCE